MFGGVEALWRGFVGEVVISKCNHLPYGREETEKKKQMKKKREKKKTRSNTVATQ